MNDNNDDPISMSIYGSIEECDKERARRAAASAPVPRAASTLGQQVAAAQEEVASWPPEKLASVVLQGGDQSAIRIFDDPHGRVAAKYPVAASPAAPESQTTKPTIMTLNGHQLLAALDLIAPPDRDGSRDTDELEDELTFGVVPYLDDNGKAETSMCCWNDDTDGVLPLDGLPVAAQVARPLPTDDLRRAVREMAAALEAREWAEHVSADPDAAALESAITELVGLHDSLRAKVQASDLPQSFATVKRLDGTDCPVYTAEQLRTAQVAALAKWCGADAGGTQLITRLMAEVNELRAAVGALPVPVVATGLPPLPPHPERMYVWTEAEKRAILAWGKGIAAVEVARQPDEPSAEKIAALVLRDICEISYDGEFDEEKMLAVSIEDLTRIVKRHARFAAPSSQAAPFNKFAALRSARRFATVSGEADPTKADWYTFGEDSLMRFIESIVGTQAAPCEHFYSFNLCLKCNHTRRPTEGSQAAPDAKKLQETLTSCAGILDTIKMEWSKTSSWSDYDQSVRNSISACLSELGAVNLAAPDAKAEREECAKVCDALFKYHKETGRHVLATVAEHCAFNIRRRAAQSQAAPAATADIPQEVREFITTLTLKAGGMLSGNRLSMAAKELLDKMDAAATAELTDEQRLTVFIDWYLREGTRAEIHADGYITSTTREHIIAWLDRSILAAKKGGAA